MGPPECPILALHRRDKEPIDGTPVVGTAVGGMAEIISDGVNGRLVPVKDSAALAKVFEEIALDPSGTVDRWRANLPKARTIGQIEADYSRMYAELMHAPKGQAV